MKSFKKTLVHSGAFAAGLFAAVTVWQNVKVKTTRYTLTAAHLPRAFDGFRIALLSDIHSRDFGGRQEQLMRRIRGIRPDLIVVAGDWVDARRGCLDTCLEQARLLRRVAPVCGVYGNHELRRIAASGRDEIGPALERAGVQLLHTSGTRVEKDGAFINLIGVEDPAGLPERPRRSQMTQAVDEMLARVTHGVAPDEFTILLAHRPEFLTLYAGYPIDLVTAGHAHGGQVRLPGVGGLFAPGQGLFPKYTGGRYDQGDTAMIVSRGLGGYAPVRIFNMPEVVAITLRTQKKTGRR